MLPGIILSFVQYLLSTYCVPVPGLGAADISVGKRYSVFLPGLTLGTGSSKPASKYDVLQLGGAGRGGGGVIHSIKQGEGLENDGRVRWGVGVQV